MIADVLLYLIAFSFFVVLQSLMINGIHDSCRGQKLFDSVTKKTDYQGMIFYELFPKFFEKYKTKKWSRPLWSCVKCMASAWGTVTFLPLVIYIFGWHWIELFILCMDIFILVYLNFFFYKKSIMILAQLVDVIYKFAAEGRPRATARTIRKSDIEQFVNLTFGNLLRTRLLESRKIDEFGKSDYSDISPILATIPFKLSEPNTVGMRRADMRQYDLYRLPNDAHVTNIYPIGGTCGSDEIGTVSLVEPGEERFYQTPEFNFFMFGVVKGRGIDLYHLPICVDEVGIETTYNSDQIDVSFDVAFEVANHILGVILKLPAFTNKVIDNPYSPPQLELRRNLQSEPTG